MFPTLAAFTPTSHLPYSSAWTKRCAYLAIVNDRSWAQRIQLPSIRVVCAGEIVRFSLQGDPARGGGATIAFLDTILPSPTNLQKLLGHLVQVHDHHLTPAARFVEINVCVDHLAQVLLALRALTTPNVNILKKVFCDTVCVCDFDDAIMQSHGFFRNVKFQTDVALMGPKTPVLDWERECIHRTVDISVTEPGPAKRTLLRRPSPYQAATAAMGGVGENAVKHMFQTVVRTNHPHFAGQQRTLADHQFISSSFGLLEASGEPGEERELKERIIIMNDGTLVKVVRSKRVVY